MCITPDCHAVVLYFKPEIEVTDSGTVVLIFKNISDYERQAKDNSNKANMVWKDVGGVVHMYSSREFLYAAPLNEREKEAVVAQYKKQNKQCT